jgi:hypothetical protein
VATQALNASTLSWIHPQPVPALGALSDYGSNRTREKVAGAGSVCGAFVVQGSVSAAENSKAPRAGIRTQTVSPNSLMHEGLPDGLDMEPIADLLAFLRGGE